MSNERLRAALVAAGKTPQQLSEDIGVDPKTVERWVSQDRTPHRTHRLKVACLLSRDDVYLWPATAADPRAKSASEAELVGLYPNRGSVGVEMWQSLISSSTESIDLLAYAASFLHDAVPDFAETLAAKARAGVRVRLLFGDPDSAAVALRGEEEGIGALMAARCRLTWAYFEPILNDPGVEARKHGSTLYNSIFRFDDTVLVNPHTLGAAASQSPILHFKRVPGGRLFTHHMSGFEHTWSAAHKA
ncbi:XRE family transcriptional regulator [Pengzhenrongella sp.]|jgi:transcriptional regulator with XRE-family HTH domain|uniref:XRE family transcriptional regulator n=1 Tax=Pengzhenrongella sp. TaxID=2888820 RepID=UPI002F94D028